MKKPPETTWASYASSRPSSGCDDVSTQPNHSELSTRSVGILLRHYWRGPNHPANKVGYYENSKQY
jgi:hypothetical protein